MSKPQKRSKKSYRNNLERSPATLQARQRILIVTEGQTEAAYFNALRNKWRLHGTVIVENPDCTDPVSLLASGKQEYDEKKKHDVTSLLKGGYDAVWLVYDLEKPNSTDRRKQSKKVINKITGKGYTNFRIAQSDPAFEFWYVLHFERTTKSFTGADEVIKHLQKHWQKEFGKSYKKGHTLSREELEIILDKTATARSNAVWVRRQLATSQSTAPITDVDKLWDHSIPDDALPSLYVMCLASTQ